MDLVRLTTKELLDGLPQLAARIPRYRWPLLRELIRQTDDSSERPLVSWGVRSEDRLSAACAGRSLAGGLAVVACILAEESSGAPFVRAAVEAVETALAGAGARFLQAVAGDPWTDTLLMGCGFERLAELSYLESARPWPDALTTRADGVRALVVDDPKAAELLEATFVESLDCPRLSAFRSPAETLAGYRGLPGFHPEGWRVLEVGGRSVGLVIVTPSPVGDVCELTYMGVIPDARGRGNGLALIGEAQSICERLGRNRLVLGVDLQNWPARTLYERAGFVEFQREVFYGKALTS